MSIRARATFGFRLCDCCGVEFTYLGLFRDTASATFDKTDPNSFPIFPNDFAGNVFVNFDHLQTNYSIYLNSFEMNFPCCCGCCSQCCCECCGQASARRRPAAVRQGAATSAAVAWNGSRASAISTSATTSTSTSNGTSSAAWKEREITRFTRRIASSADRSAAGCASTVNRFGFELTGEAGIYDNSAKRHKA